MTLLPLAGAAALLLAPAASPAERPVTTPVTTSVTVTHADLDLSTRRGLAMLDTRIARAARAACGYVSPSDLAGRNRLRDCRDQARASVASHRDQLVVAAKPVEVATTN